MKDKLQDYFSGRLSPGEEQKMQKWLCENAFDEDVDALMMDIFASCEAARRRQEEHSTLRHKVSIVATAIAAILAMVAFIPYAYNKGVKGGRAQIASIGWTEVNVPEGSDSTVVLPDGSRLHLNAGSRLTYPQRFTGDKRTVFLDGEAYAQVRKDPSCPMVIRSGETTITVKGTTFNYKGYKENRTAELLLLDGHVDVSIDTPAGKRRVVMSPGNKMQYNRPSGKVDLSDFDAQKYKTFYEDRSLHFFDVDMHDIALELSRRFGVKIMVMDEKLSSKRYFAIFTNNESVDEVLRTINSDRSMKITRTEDIIYLQSNHK